MKQSDNPGTYPIDKYLKSKSQLGSQIGCVHHCIVGNLISLSILLLFYNVVNGCTVFSRFSDG